MVRTATRNSFNKTYLFLFILSRHDYLLFLATRKSDFIKCPLNGQKKLCRYHKGSKGKGNTMKGQRARHFIKGKDATKYPKHGGFERDSG